MECGQTGMNGQNVQSLVMVVFKFGQECVHSHCTMENGVKDIILKIEPAIIRNVPVCY